MIFVLFVNFCTITTKKEDQNEHFGFFYWKFENFAKVSKPQNWKKKNITRSSK
jgi:hypothetical protein